MSSGSSRGSRVERRRALLAPTFPTVVVEHQARALAAAVYLLIDGDDGIEYVGKTGDGVAGRLIDHRICGGKVWTAVSAIDLGALDPSDISHAESALIDALGPRLNRMVPWTDDEVHGWWIDRMGIGPMRGVVAFLRWALA